MKKLDWYIFRKLVVAYVFVVVILCLVICVIDWSEKNDDFVQSDATLNQILFDYFLNLIPYWASVLSPLMVFISSIFVTARLASHTEIIAMLSAGVSFRRITRPYFLAAILIGLVNFIGIAWFIPKANTTRLAFEFTYLKNQYYYDGRNIHIKTSPDTYVYMESYNNRLEVGYKFTIEKIVDNQLLSKLSSPKINWNEELEKWHLNSYTIHNFGPEGEEYLEGRSLDTALNFLPDDFERQERLYETFTVSELTDYIRELRMRGAENIEPYIIERYERFTYPAAIVILALMGLISASRKNRRGTGVQIAFGFVLAFVYILFVMMSRSIAQVGGFSPLMGALFPSIVFALVALLMYRNVPK
ncbi:MAG: LptF/LptG family permease [Cytophagales bacterium]